jgi:hypothetical protein
MFFVCQESSIWAGSGKSSSIVWSRSRKVVRFERRLYFHFRSVEEPLFSLLTCFSLAFSCWQSLDSYIVIRLNTCRIWRILMMVYNTQNYWVSGFFHRPEFKIQKNTTFQKLDLFPSSEFRTMDRVQKPSNSDKILMFSNTKSAYILVMFCYHHHHLHFQCQAHI